MQKNDKRQSKRPDVKKLHLKVDPCQGVAALVAGIVPEKGYAFQRLERQGNKATVTFVKTNE